MLTEASTGGAPSCGDGVLQPERGESCDEGEANSDSGACTLDCQLAACGDGLVHAGVEECDDSGASSECDEDCTAVVCGDGVVNTLAGEDCEFGVDGQACTLGCEAARWIFVSSKTNNGDFNGLGGADEFCQDLADDAGLEGEFLAWLSGGGGPAQRFSISSLPYVLVDGTVVAVGWVGLSSGELVHAIDQTEFGEEPTLTEALFFNCAYPGYNGGIFPAVFTNVTADGSTQGNNDCGGWSSIEGYGRFGIWAATDNRWTSWCQTLGGCASSSHVYCVEQ